jgi:hypothetical protein
MSRDLTTLDLDAHVLANEARIRERQLALGAQLEAMRDGDVRHGTAVASAARAHTFANALAQGTMQGFGVASSLSRDGLKSVELVLGHVPIGLPNERAIPSIPGDYRMRGNVRAIFTIADGSPWIDYWE